MTLAELSQKAGCSQATISRVLNRSAFVSDAVRDTVLRVVREAGYVRRGARAARIDRPGRVPGPRIETIEVVVHRHTPQECLAVERGRMILEPPADVPVESMLTEARRFSEAFHRHITDGVIDEISRWGGKVVLQANKDLLAPVFLDDLNRPDHRGILLLGEYSPDLDRFVKSCRRPLVLIDLKYAGWPDVVTIDNAAGMEQIVQHLLDLGHRRIGYVGGTSNPAFAERWEMLRWHLFKADLTVQPAWCHAQGEPIGEAAAGLVPFLRRAGCPSALVCANDCAALAVLRAAELAGIEVPRQLSVVGFDDVDAAALVTPALTTVQVPLTQIGRMAVRLLMTQGADWPRLANGGTETRVRPHLVVRQTTAAPEGRRAGVRTAWAPEAARSCA